MVAVLGYSKEEIRQAVKDMYTIVATKPTAPLHFPIGREAAKLAGYSEDQISDLPDESLESFAGVGCPFRANVVKPGQTVVDIGSGSGTDVLLAAKLVGSSGKVIAVDLTPAMREKLQRTLKKHNITNVEIMEGDAENIPLPNEIADVVTSNGVLNLVADKRKAISEIFRIVKPNGHVQIADIVIASPVTPDCEDDPKLWAECVVGATVDESYLEMFRDAGFENLEVLRDYDYFAHSPSEDTKEVAKQFGAHAFELRMTRSVVAPVKMFQIAKRLDPRRVIRNIQRRGLWGTTSLVMAVIACYGTLALAAVMGMLGISMAVNEGIWAGAIILFAILACGVIALGMRKHHSPKPVIVAIIGTAILVYTMYINYQIVTEIAGFIVLSIATWLDFDLRRWAKVPGGKKAGSRNQRN